MIKKEFILLFVLLALVLSVFCSAAIGEELTFSEETTIMLDILESGPNCLPENGYGIPYSYRIMFDGGIPVESAEVQWLSGDDALKNMFIMTERNNTWTMRFNSSFSAVGTAAFRITATAATGSLSRDITVSIGHLVITEPAEIIKSEVSIGTNESFDLTTAGILFNPDHFTEEYFVATGSSSSSQTHSWEDADGLRYDLRIINDHYFFTATEAGTYHASVSLVPCGNLRQWLDFDIVVTDNGSAAPAITFSDNTLYWFSEIENGPIYLPTDHYPMSGGMYYITLNNDRTVDNLQVEWLGGEESLQDMFTTENYGIWCLGFADSLGSTGTARFRLTAFSGEDSVSREFTATVSEPDLTKAPVQLKTVVRTETNSPIDLTAAGILQNPDRYQESYRLKAGNDWVYSHTSEDEDGLRYTFGFDGTTSYRFIAEEAGTYEALVRANFGINLLTTFYFNIEVTDGTQGTMSGECGSQGGNLTWEMTDNGVLIISGQGDMADYSWNNFAPWSSTGVTLRQVILQEGITGIGNYAFYSSSDLTQVTIPEGVTRIGYDAFCLCSSLTDIVLPTTLASIGDSAFASCSELTEITLYGTLSEIGQFAFVSSGLTTITVPDETEVNTWYFFYRNYRKNNILELVGVTVPASVEILDVSCFFGTYLPAETPDIMTPEELTSIETEAFSGTSARFVWLSDSVSSIGDGAFANCHELQFIRIPNHCTSIGENAFPANTILLVDRWEDAYEAVEQIGNPMIFLCEGFNG